MADQSLLPFLVTGAVLRAKKCGKTPAQVLEEIILARFTSEGMTGRAIISISEAGGSTAFATLKSMSPEQLAALVTEALFWVNSQPDPTKPDLSLIQPKRRMRCVFDKPGVML